MKRRCIIVDDEPLAREGMELLVKEAGFLEVRASCSNAFEATKCGQKSRRPHFLAIQMPGIRGIDFMKSPGGPPLVIIHHRLSPTTHWKASN